MHARRVVPLLFSALFVGVLLCGLAALICKPKEEISYYENRTLAQVPAFSLQSLWDGTYFSEWDTYVSDHAPGRETLLRLQLQIDQDVLHRPVVNDIISTENQLVYFYGTGVTSRAEMQEKSAAMAERCAQINELVESYGGVCLFVTVPTHTNYFLSTCPEYLTRKARDYSAINQQYLAAMAARGVPTLDLAECFDAAGHPDNFYYSTDHHMTIYGAMCAYQAILEKLDTLAGDTLSAPAAYSTDQLTLQTLPNPFSGSRARNLFGLTAIRDSLTVGTWSSDVSFTRQDAGEPAAETCLTLPETETETVGYSCFMGGDQAETVIQTERPELPSLLVWGDSYTNVLESLLYIDFDEMRSLDLRYYANMCLSDYIEQYQPDYVVCVRDYSALLDTPGNGAIE